MADATDRLQTLRADVEQAGIATMLRPDPAGGVHLVVATRRTDGALGGNSFRMSYRGGRWYLFTWTPNFYRLPQTVEPSEVCIASLQAASTAISTLPDSIVQRFGLEGIDEEEYDAVVVEILRSSSLRGQIADELCETAQESGG